MSDTVLYALKHVWRGSLIKENKLNKNKTIHTVIYIHIHMSNSAFVEFAPG